MQKALLTFMAIYSLGFLSSIYANECDCEGSAEICTCEQCPCPSCTSIKAK